jgi:acyl dehydratase
MSHESAGGARAPAGGVDAQSLQRSETRIPVVDGVSGVGGGSVSGTRWFEDFYIGEHFALPARRMSAAIFKAFAEASGETHPLHTDAEYCRARGMPDMLAHGFLVVSQTVAGAGAFPYLVEESLIGLLEQSSRFARPVYACDTLYPALTVVELAPNTSTGVVGLRSTIHNQRRELVLEGTQRWLLRMRPTG